MNPPKIIEPNKDAPYQGNHVDCTPHVSVPWFQYAQGLGTPVDVNMRLGLKNVTKAAPNTAPTTILFGIAYGPFMRPKGNRTFSAVATISDIIICLDNLIN